MLTHVSATSIQLFREGCNRKWYERYVLGKKGDSSPAMILGNKVHTQLENYLKEGEEIDKDSIEGKIARSGIDLIPRPASHLKIEISLEELPIENTPVLFKGFIDVFIPALHTEDGISEILDHKTTSSFKYAKTEDELKENLQLLIYARHVLETYPSEDEIRLTHVSYLTKTPYKAIKRSVVVSREHVYEKFESILETVRLMLLASEQDVHQMEKNEKFCWSYGKKCSYYDDCMITINNKGVSKMSKKHLEVIDILRGESKPKSKVSKKEKTRTLTTLYVGCRPLKSSVVLVQDAIKEMSDAICTSKNVEHISFVPYAQGWDLLSSLILKNGLKEHTNLYIDPRSQLYLKCGDALVQVVDEVITVS